MAERKELIEEITNNFHIIKNKIYENIIAPGLKNGITNSQLFVLKMISEHEKSNVKKISEKLHISSSAVTQLVDSLVAKGYAVRQENKSDRRHLELVVSEKGKEIISKMKAKKMELFEKVFSALEDSELASFLALQKKIIAKVIKQNK